jgi:hypothetical protein
MANWLERAKREIPAGTDRATVKTAGRNPTAVKAVPEPGEPVISRGSIGSKGSAPRATFQEIEPDLASLINRMGAFWGYDQEDFQIVRKSAAHDPDGWRRLCMADKERWGW